MNDNRGIVIINEKQMKGDQCLHGMLGEYIDVEWDIKSGEMKVSSTKSQSFSHSINQQRQIFSYVPLKHGAHCPLINDKIVKNSQRTMRPCSVVMLQIKQENTFLATQRPANISFGGKWVLPGGHLQQGEGIIDGGIRECVEEVGFDKNKIKEVKLDVMAWQSVYVENQQIKRTGLVLFFRIQTDKFDVKGQEGEIQNWEWRKLGENGQPWGGGWAEGHLTYLKFLNEYKK